MVIIDVYYLSFPLLGIAAIANRACHLNIKLHYNQSTRRKTSMRQSIIYETTLRDN